MQQKKGQQLKKREEFIFNQSYCRHLTAQYKLIREHSKVSWDSC